MRVSQLFIPTLREAPSEAELVSHKLMLRAGLIDDRKGAALKVLDRIRGLPAAKPATGQPEIGGKS